MDKPWKVICAFVGVFMAGAIFGGLFTLRASGKRFASDPARLRPVVTAPAPAAVEPPPPTVPPAQPTPSTSKVAAQPPGNQPTVTPGRIAPALMRTFTQRLSPTAEQRDKIRPIVSRAAEDLQRLQREHLQDTTRVTERMYEDVSALLSPEQRTHLEKMRQEMLERVRKERERQRGDGSAKGNTSKSNAAAQANPNRQQGP